MNTSSAIQINYSVGGFETVVLAANDDTSIMIPGRS
jgi:hypothetical protein